ncbi:MAG: DUF1805 domain-containing protein [Archaeoglobi archaeon]|nr:MAG: DUF1805 domain-containing protein [Archaeoglobi archaeon]
MYGVISVELLEVSGKKVLAIRIELPNAPLLLMFCDEVVIGCGYLSIEAMEKLGNCACVVRGVRNFEEMLNAEIQETTSKLEKLGARKGMKVRELLEIIGN